MSEKNNFIFYCEQNLEKQKEEKETELFIDNLLTGDWLSDFHFQELFTDLTLHRSTHSQMNNVRSQTKVRGEYQWF